MTPSERPTQRERVLLYESIQTFTLFEAREAHFDVQGYAVERAVSDVRYAVARDTAIVVDTYPDPVISDAMRVQARTPDWRSAVEVAATEIEAACHAMTLDSEPHEIDAARRRLAETAADMRHLLDKFRPPAVGRNTP